MFNKESRVAVFAHYDGSGCIEDYVVFYIKELKKIADKIIFVSDSDIEESELSKIQDYIVGSIVGKHGEYDFGSYKRGFFRAKELGLFECCEELVLANDSCYAPLFSFEYLYKEMSDRNVDFWGVTANPEGLVFDGNRIVVKKQLHVQSYFIDLKKQVFSSPVFENFMKEITRQENKEKIVALYECGLTEVLAGCGFKYDVFCESSKNNVHSHIYKYKNLIKKEKSPFLKRSIPLYKFPKEAYPFLLKSFILRNTTYDYSLIEKDIVRNAQKYSKMQKISFALRCFSNWVLRIRIKQRRIYIFGHLFDFS